MIKKADIILLIVIVVLGGLVSYFSIAGRTAGDTVVVYVDGDVYGEYPLSEDREIEIINGEHINNISIKDGHVQMAYSNCKNQVCVDTGIISTTGKQIACLPNKVLIEIKSTAGGGVDVISG